MRRSPKPHVPSRRNWYTKLRLENLESRTQPSVQVASLAAFQIATASGTLNRESISDDGRYVVFSSTADNITPNDSDGLVDVFLHDRTLNTVALVSRDKSGNAIGAIGPDTTVGSVPVISGDGRYVVFASQAEATMVVTGSAVTDANFATTDVFRYDRMTGDIALVSRDVDGNAASGEADVSISTDGNVVAFASFGNNLIAGLPGSRVAIYAYNFGTGTMTLVSQTPGGVVGNENSYNPLVSRDGTSVLFSSLASNILGPGTDTNTLDDLYLTRISDGSTVLVSQDINGNAAGVPGQFSYEQSGISDDGNFVAFIADTNLSVAPVANDPRDKYYTFLFDRSTDAVSIVSRNMAGKAVGNAGYFMNVAGISGDGKTVIFVSEASDIVPNDTYNALDVFLLDRTTDSIILVSRDAVGNPLDLGSLTPTMSRDGNFVGFLTSSGGFPGGTSFRSQAAVFDKTAGMVALVSRTTAGVGGNLPTDSVVISGDGSALVFQTKANNFVANDPGQSTDLFAYDRTAQTVSLVTARTGPASATSNANSTIFNRFLGALQLGLSADGQYVLFISDAGNIVANDTNNEPDIFLYDRIASAVTLVSRDLNGNPAGAPAFIVGPIASISRDGNWVTFNSASDNIVPNDTNFANDVFLFNRVSGAITLVSHKNGETVPAGAFRGSNSSTISDDGRFVAFISRDDLTGENPGFVAAGYLYDRTSDQSVLVSRTLTGGVADVLDQNSYYAPVTVSGDGSTVVFQTIDANVVAGDANGKSDVFRFVRSSGAIELVSRTTIAGVGDNGSFYPQVSRDGTIVSFHSLASNLTPVDTNGGEDLFVYNSATQSVSVVSRTSTGAAGGGVSDYDGAVSADGKYVVFTSSSALEAADTNGAFDIYLYDRLANSVSLVSRTATGTASAGNSFFFDDQRRWRDYRVPKRRTRSGRGGRAVHQQYLLLRTHVRVRRARQRRREWQGRQ